MRLGFLLFQQVQQMERKPPVTIALVLSETTSGGPGSHDRLTGAGTSLILCSSAVQVLIFIRPEGFEFIPSIQDACLQPYLVFKVGHCSSCSSSQLLSSCQLDLKELYVHAAIGHLSSAVVRFPPCR